VPSTILISQLPVSRCHEQIGNHTLLMASSTGSFTMHTAVRCTATQSAMPEDSRTDAISCRSPWRPKQTLIESLLSREGNQGPHLEDLGRLGRWRGPEILRGTF
jgi:hypothetical protein